MAGTSSTSVARLRLVEPPSGGSTRRKLVEDGVLAMLLFLFVELMLFAGMISGYVIVEGAAPDGMWPPPDQPRLPWQSTLINTAALIASGFILFSAQRAFGRDDRETARKRLGLAIGLGAFFVAFQGFEWVSLIGEGLTMRSSQLGAFFYLIVGCHGLHALAALAGLSWAARELRADRLRESGLQTAGLFWYFVVGMWPVLYGLVYL